MFVALAPGAISLACVASWKPPVTFSWHSAHVLVPVNCAPGMCGGMMIARFTMTHETSIRPQTAEPPKIRVFLDRRNFEIMGAGLARCGADWRIPRRGMMAERGWAGSARVGKCR